MKWKLKSSLSICLVLLSAACATDKAFIANSAAEHVYLESEYEHLCVQAVGPPACKARQAALNELKRELQAADNVLHIGAIPKKERAAIKAALKEARK